MQIYTIKQYKTRKRKYEISFTQKEKDRVIEKQENLITEKIKLILLYT
jgi:hypothetical protein